jgi:hypothetical protein
VVFLGKTSVGGLDDLVLGLGIDLQDLVGIQGARCHRLTGAKASASTRAGRGRPGSGTNRGRAVGAFTRCSIARAD